MKSVICFGEALIDFLQTSATLDDGLTLPNYRQYPGGAPANAAVAVAKLGGNAYFAGQVGNDAFGNFIGSALTTYQVNTQFLMKHPSAKTALAFVMLDSNGERSFSFHREQSADLLITPSQIDDGWFVNQPIFHFCSNTLTENNIANCTQFAVSQARQHHATISFDVNLRHNLWPDNQVDKTVVNPFVQQAHLVKFSAEEFDYLAGGNTKHYLEQCFNGACKLIIVTDGADTIHYYLPNQAFSYVPPSIIAVDTTAGGDGFIGGFLFALAHIEQLDTLLSQPQLLRSIIEFSAHCGAVAVSRAGAFPALASLNEVASLYQQSNQGKTISSELTAILSGANNAVL